MAGWKKLLSFWFTQGDKSHNRRERIWVYRGDRQMDESGLNGQSMFVAYLAPILPATTFSEPFT